MPGSLTDIYVRLRDHFGLLTGPDARRPWWPLYSDDQPFEILVGAVLVQQTRWETVEAATLRLIAAGLLAPQALAATDGLTLAALIRPAAFHAQKAPGLIAIARHICLRHGGSTAAMLAQPTAPLRAELLALPRVGPETCDVTMLYGGGHPVFVVDEYTRRLLERVGVWNANDAKAVAAKNPKAKVEGRETDAGEERSAGTFWRRASYEAVRLTIEAGLAEEPLLTSEAELPAAPPRPLTPGPLPSTPSPQPPALNPQAPVPSPLSPLYADYHAQINEVCVRYCLARPRCDGPPARRVYSLQAGRESYLDRDDGCPLRPICAHYVERKAGLAA
jgi:endonuclease-3 related protein